MPTVINLSPKRLRYEQIRHEIQQRLAQGIWQVGEPIPSEHILAEEFAVSIGTIRKAIELLVSGGLLVKIQGKGTFVRQPDFSASLCRFFRHRNKNGEIQLPTGKVECIQRLEHGIAEINQLFGNAHDAAQIYMERTRTLDGTVLVSEKIWLPENRFAALLNVDKADFGNLLYPFYLERCACLIVSVKEQLTFMPALSDAYLQINQEAAIKICRWAYDLSGAIVEYRESFGRASDFCYETIIA